MSSSRTSSNLAASLVHVCVAPELAKQFESILRSMRWEVSSTGFDSYISATRRPSMPPQIKAATVAIALVDFDNGPQQATESTRYLKQFFQGAISVIAIGQPNDPALLLAAMRAGCSEFLQKPFNEDTVKEMIHRLEGALDQQQMQAKCHGTILSFFGAKGGVGTTTIAVHLGAYLAQVHKKKTLLIDNHAELGHCCVYLGLDGSHYHFFEVVRNVSRLDSELLRGYIARHSSGLDVLSSPDICGYTRGNDPQSMMQTLEFLRGEYDFIIIDSAMFLDGAAAAVIEASTNIYLVATPEIGPIRDLARQLDAFGGIKTANEKLQVLVNRYPSTSAVTIEQIQAAIKRTVSLHLPNAYVELTRTENLGQPLPPGGKSDFTKEMLRWTKQLTGDLGGLDINGNKRRLFDNWALKPLAEAS